MRISISAFLFTLTMASIANAAPSKSGGSSSIMIPVRLGISAGYNNSGVSYDLDRKNELMSSFAMGGDFNIPIPPIRTMLGITGWLVPAVGSGNSSRTSAMIVGAYIGYFDDKTDFFVGPAIGTFSTIIRSATSPVGDIDLSITSACGMAGWRRYFGKGLTAGIGLNGYACGASTYDKSVANTSTDTTKSVVDGKASSVGGFLYFFLSWNEERKLI